MAALPAYAPNDDDVWAALEYGRQLGTGSYEEAVDLCEREASVGRWGYWTEWTGGDPVSVMDQLGPVARPDARSGTGYRVVRIGDGPGTVARDDFGHVPLLIHGGKCGGCEVCGDVEEQLICARCPTAAWPCASAVALGCTTA